MPSNSETAVVAKLPDPSTLAKLPKKVHREQDRPLTYVLPFGKWQSRTRLNTVAERTALESCSYLNSGGKPPRCL